jgi:hypothetical protein
LYLAYITKLIPETRYYNPEDAPTNVDGVTILKRRDFKILRVEGR